MGVPKGFRKVVFHLTQLDDSPKVECLVCDECQAMLLLNSLGDFANKHREWHEKINAAAKKLSDIYDAAAISGTKESLDARADWEKIDTLKGSKK